jgi:flavin-dependent dehydrogenase
MPRLATGFDCAIVGGGPAGAVLAGILARWGHAVVLCDDGRARRAVPEETLLPAATTALDRLGLRELVTANAFTDAMAHAALWERAELTRQAGGEEGLRVARGPFDAALRQWARGEGAVVLDNHRVLGPLPATGGGSLRCIGPDGDRELAARVLVVAIGRARLHALLPVAVLASGPDTAAFCVLGGARAADCEHSVIEAVADGWLWWMPLRAGGAAVAVFTDAAAAKVQGARALVTAMLASALGPAARLQAPAIRLAVRATARLHGTTLPVLLVGDAASTIDPLSSQGVEKALASAEVAAVAVHTALLHPEHRAAAFAAHAQWERGLWHAHARVAAAFYARAQRFSGAPFWRARVPQRTPPATPPPAAPAVLVRRRDLREGTTMRRVGRLYEPDTGFALPGDDDLLARIGPVAIAPLLTAFAQPRTLADGVRAAGQDPRLFVLSPRVVQEATVELWRRGFLNPASVPESP